MFTRIMDCRLAESACDSAVLKATTVSFPPHVVAMAAGWSDPDAGWELHPLETNTLYTAHNGSDPEETSCK